MASFKRRANKQRSNVTTQTLFSARVRDLASDGRGVVAHPSGKTCFVAGVWPGEEGQFRLVGGKGRVGFAELVSLEIRSEQRVAPRCGHHGFEKNQCGGCPWQFMSYEAQLQAKQDRVVTVLQRLLPNLEVLPIVASPKVFGYRNRAQFKTDGESIGYVASQTNTLAAIQGCDILSDKNRQTLAELLQLLPNCAWQPSRKQTWVTLDIDESVDAQTVAVNRRLPFQQGNSEQNLFMRHWLSEKLLAVEAVDEAVELFCGSGNLTQVLASSSIKKVLAVDVAAEALQTLKDQRLEKVQALECDLFDEAGLHAVKKALASAQLLVLDPPRDGWKTREAAWPGKTALRNIFYISCDLATFRRDLEFFLKRGFVVEEVQPMDQFPHTPHIELLASLKQISG